MTITRVQAPLSATGTTSATATFASAPTEGNLLIARCKGSAASGAGAIAGWTAAVDVMYGVSSGWITTLYKIAGAGESSDVTVAFTSGNPTRCTIEEWSNTDGWAGLDVVAKTATSSGTSKSSGTTAATAIAISLCVTHAAMGGAVTSPSWSASYATDFTEPVGGIVDVGGSLVVAATGAQESTLSWTTTRYCAADIAVFKGNAPAASGKPYYAYAQQ